MTRGPSPHLAWKEMACHDGTPYPDEWRMTRGKVLARTFERVRASLARHAGRLRPLTVLSCYRTPEHNKAVGGAKDSMHLYGLAIDLRVPPGVEVDQLAAAAEDILAGKGGIFRYPWGIHVDRRDYLGRPAGRGDYR